jgi:hypothetical protein
MLSVSDHVDMKKRQVTGSRSCSDCQLLLLAVAAELIEEME